MKTKDEATTDADALAAAYNEYRRAAANYRSASADSAIPVAAASAALDASAAAFDHWHSLAAAAAAIDAAFRQRVSAN